MIRLLFISLYITAAILAAYALRLIFRWVLPFTDAAVQLRTAQVSKAVKSLGPKIVDTKCSWDMGIAKRLIPSWE